MEAIPVGLINWALNNRVVHVITLVTTVCGVAHTFLPPWDWNPDFIKEGLCEFPTVQTIFRKALNNRWYRILIYTVGYVAIHGRSTVWNFISVKNPEGPNANLPTPDLKGKL